MDEQKLLGVLGYPIEHSKSPSLFASIFTEAGVKNWTYERFGYASLNDFFLFSSAQKNLAGFNVTIPYKEQIIPFLDTISPEAKALGAVNTVVCTEINNNKHYAGFNTDLYGFEQSLLHLKNEIKKAFVLGSGGASKAVCWVLQKKQIPYQVVSRNPKAEQIEYAEIKNHLQEKNLVINCSPVGMQGPYPPLLDLPFELFNINDSFIHLVYNPETTPNIEEMKKQGVECLNGEIMLEQQAQKAWQIFKYHHEKI